MAAQASRIGEAGAYAAKQTRPQYEATGAYLTDGLTSGFGSRVHAFIDKVRQTANGKIIASKLTNESCKILL